MMDRELSETCRFSFQNKFEKLVRLVGFIIRKQSIEFEIDGVGGLVVSMLASGTQVRGFKPGRSR
jgi:hypothetical protein